MPGWTHIYINKVMPGSSYGTSGPVLADFDHDGDLDAIISRRLPGEAYLYERKNDTLWIPHLVGQLGNAAEGLGCTAIDMDNDGWIDAVFEMVWFKNPGNLNQNPDAPWKMFNYKGGGHDIVSCDTNGDGKDEVIVYDGRKLSIYDPFKKMDETIISFGHDDHGGIAPHGFGDIDGDGKIDLVIPGFWFKNGGDGKSWVKHEWPFTPVPNASYGRSTRSWIVDINKDGIMQPEEPGMANVQVDLYRVPTVGDPYIVDTQYSGANGYFTFGTGLPAGTYYEQYHAPAGYVFTIKDAGTNDWVDSDVDSTGKTDPLTVTSYCGNSSRATFEAE
jgi:hypothetical protein